MSSILVVDDMAIFRDPIAASLRLAGYTTYCAADGVAGLAELRANHPDLVLLDVSMPLLDGIGFLRTMRRDPGIANTPVILLTARADKKFVIEAAQLGVRDYLLKSRFSLTELNDRIKRVLAMKSSSLAAAIPRVAAARGPKTDALVVGSISLTGTGLPQLEPFVPEKLLPLLNRQQCISRIESCMAGKTLSGAVAEVMMLASRPSAELRDLSALITRDPTLSVRVLQMANSAAFFCRRGAVSTITDAVKNIGANNVRNIAASVGIFDAMPASSADGFNPIRCWQHSFAVARLCESFVTPTAPREAGLAYLVGLCHDLGEIMFRTRFEKEYQSVLDVHQRTGAPLERIERRLLGMTQSEILMVILKCIGLPENIREPIERFHQNHGTAGRDPVALRALALAENYANGLLLASSESSPISPVPEKDWAALSGQTRLAAPDGEEIRSQVYCLTAILSRLNSADQAGLTKFPYKKSKARVWLARDPFFCSADPLAAALRELASVKLQDRLPTALELCDVSALVVESRGKDRPSLNRQSIEYCLQANVKIPLLWLVNESSTAPAGSTLEPVQAVTLRTIEDFVGRALPLAPIVAA